MVVVVTNPAPDAARPEGVRPVERHGHGALNIIAAHINRANAERSASNAAFWETVRDEAVILLSATRVGRP